MAQRSLTSPPVRPVEPRVSPLSSPGNVGRDASASSLSPLSPGVFAVTNSQQEKGGVRKDLQETKRFINSIVKKELTKLKRREIGGAFKCAMATADLLRQIVEVARFDSVLELIECVRETGKRLSAARRVELTIGNITRRVLYIIRQEVAHLHASGSANIVDQQRVDISASLHKMLDTSSDLDFKIILSSDLKTSIKQEITEMIEEIDTVKTTIADQAIEHIHAKEVVMTFGRSHTVWEFLKSANAYRKFEVYVAEAAPSYEGQYMANLLADDKIETTLITDSAIFAIMSRCNKVIIGTHAVLANGGLLAPTGTLNLAVTAHYHKVPVVVVTGIYKLSPLYAFDQDTFNEHKSPSEILEFDKEFTEFCSVENPAFDYVPPEYVDLFVTNLGGHNPSYIYRLLAECYNSDDYDL